MKIQMENTDDVVRPSSRLEPYYVRQKNDWEKLNFLYSKTGKKMETYQLLS